MNLQIPFRDEEGRPLLRTFAEVTEALQRAGLTPHARITIRTGEFALPNGADTLICLCVKNHRKEAQIVRLPATSIFYATTSDGTRQSFPAMRLDGARLFPDGSVRLRNGQFLHAIDLKPPALPDIRREDLQLLKDIIAALNLDDICYRELAPNIFPGLRILDFGLLPLVRLPLKVISRPLFESGIEISRQTLDRILRASGMRLPRSTQARV